jgi:hypothetical protein
MSGNITSAELGDGWPVSAPEGQGVDATTSAGSARTSKDRGRRAPMRYSSSVVG